MTETNAPHPVRPHTPGGGAVVAPSSPVRALADAAEAARDYERAGLLRVMAVADEAEQRAPADGGEVDALGAECRKDLRAFVRGMYAGAAPGKAKRFMGADVDALCTIVARHLAAKSAGGEHAGR